VSSANRPVFSSAEEVEPPGLTWGARLLTTIAKIATKTRHADAKVKPSASTVVGTTAFEGEWHWPNESRPFAIRIVNREGVATLTNASEFYAVGDTILCIDRMEEKAFSGRLMYTDGKFRQITAVLTAVDRLEFTALPGQEGRYDPQFVLVRNR